MYLHGSTIFHQLATFVHSIQRESLNVKSHTFGFESGNCHPNWAGNYKRFASEQLAELKS